MTENRPGELVRQKAAVAENLKRIHENIAQAAVASGRNPADIRLLAATKTMPPWLIAHAVACGVDLIGENRVQELEEKYDVLKDLPAEHHFIGHLQTNKVKKMVDKVSCIQSVSSVKLAAEIDKCCQNLQKTMPVLVEVNIGREQSKSGIWPEALEELLHQASRFNGLRVMGLMCIPPICEQKTQAQKFFYEIQKLFVDIRAKKIDNISMEILSMGMSDDYTEAIREGSTLVRIGTGLFGARV